MDIAKQIASHGKQPEPKVKVLERRKVKEPQAPEVKPTETVIKEVVKPSDVVAKPSPKPKAKKSESVAPVASSEPPAPKPKKQRAPLSAEQKEKALKNLELARQRKKEKRGGNS